MLPQPRHPGEAMAVPLQRSYGKYVAWALRTQGLGSWTDPTIVFADPAPSSVPRHGGPESPTVAMDNQTSRLEAKLRQRGQ